MEPLSVLGLVANIVQLIDAAAKAYTVCCEIHASGSSKEDSRTAFTSEQFREAYDELSKSLNQGNSTAVTTGTGIDLKSLATRCCRTAETLQVELNALRKAPGSGLRGTIEKAWLKQRKAKTIGELKVALDEYKKTLDSKILIDTRQLLGALGAEQEGQSKQLNQQLSQISSDLKACQSGFAVQLRSEIDKYITTNEAQHEVTRDHITNAMQDLNLSQTERLSEQRRQQHDRQQHEQFLNSLWFRDMHTRMNDVAESHPETFHWMFEDNAIRPWDSFCTWLQGDDRLYWINGKAGSGKSTLMKFLVNDSRTGDLLAQSSSGKLPVIVQFYFWLSGSEMQRSFKGFLCSIIYQLINEDDQLVAKLLPGATELLTHMIDLLDRPLCIFLDGLDEFDQKDDVDQLLNLLEDSSVLGKTKICISSRPEIYLAKRMSRYKQLRLQDLTAHDMELCIREKLETTRTQCLPASIDDEYFERIIRNVATKADGVFLWVYYALSSLVRGMRNEDDFGVLLGRIEELPNGMEQLYLQMWKRLNGDQHRYQEESTTYFSYVANRFAAARGGSISVFEMLVALDPQLQSTFLDELKPQDPIGLARKCELLQARIITRSAGLLELSMELSTYKDSSLSAGSSQSTGTMDDNESLTGSPFHQSRESLYDSACQSDAESSPRRSLQKDISYRAGIHSNDPLTVHHRTKIHYLHRTARDFLLNMEEGQRLSGRPKELPAISDQNILRARISALMQGLVGFCRDEIALLMAAIGSHCRVNAVPEHATGLLVALRRVCETLSVPDSPEHHAGYRVFWHEGDGGFEGMVVQWGFAEYIQQYIQNRDSYINPYCRGLLALNVIRRNIPLVGYHNIVALISWLAFNGADLHTPHIRGEMAFTPASEILLAINRVGDGGNDSILPQLYNTIHTMLPNLEARSCTCIIQLLVWSDGKVDGCGTAWNVYKMESPGGQFQFLAQMSIIKLCYLIMERLEHRLPSEHRWRRPDISKEPITQVVFIFEYGSDDLIKEPVEPIDDAVMVSVGELFTPRPALCPSEVDSIYLGEALERILFSGNTQTSTEEFEARLSEVNERSPLKEPDDWHREHVEAIKANGELGDDSGLYFEGLGEKWFI